MADLKTVLGPDGYAELTALLSRTPVAAPRSVWAPIVTGIIKSWTVWSGTSMIALPELPPTILPQLEQQYPGASKWIMTLFGVITILLRVKTTQSLTVKGSLPGQITSA